MSEYYWPDLSESGVRERFHKKQISNFSKTLLVCKKYQNKVWVWLLWYWYISNIKTITRVFVLLKDIKFGFEAFFFFVHFFVIWSIKKKLSFLKPLLFDEISFPTKGRNKQNKLQEVFFSPDNGIVFLCLSLNKHILLCFFLKWFVLWTDRQKQNKSWQFVFVVKYRAKKSGLQIKIALSNKKSAICSRKKTVKKLFCVKGEGD